MIMTRSSKLWGALLLAPLSLAAASCGSCGAPPAGASPIGEAVPPDEAAAIDETAKVIADGIRRSFNDAGPPARRDAHAKAHGCVKAKVTVPELPESLRVGVFQKPRTYFAWVRYSNGNGTPQADSVPDGRGMAIKLMGVEGKKILEGEADAQTQDFLMINYPAFFVDTAANYVKFEKDLQGGDVVKYFLGLRSPTSWHLGAIEVVRGITAQKVVNPLETQYFSMAAYLFGDKAIKFSAKPCAVHEGVYTATDSPTFLADNMEKNLKDGQGCFDLMIQRQTNPKDMPVEDPMKIWSEEASPFVKVARIDIPSQAFRSDEQMKFCENLSYTPWHALPEHRPLGGINRLRKVVYETISSVRHELNGVRPREPVAGPDFLP
jgi:hypothetical protein